MLLSEYTRLDAVGLAAAIASGEFTRSEAINTAIKAIEQLNPQLNAVVMQNYENARAAAARTDSALESSADSVADSSNRPLAGVPFLLKDVNVFTHDMPTTFSCRFFRDAKPGADSEIVKRWRSAGLVVLGKTNTPEFAEDFVCESTFRGPALNPWNTTVTTGGSSGGAAAAVASGMVAIAHGTDLGGSIRIPAACCGVYGLKPTTGLNPVDSSHPELASGFNSDHVLTRSVRDSAAALDATAVAIPGNRYPVLPAVPSFLGCLGQPLATLRIGVCVNTPCGAPTPARQQAAVQNVREVLAENGHEMVEYAFPPDLDLAGSMDALWMFDIVYELERQIALTGREPEAGELESITHYIRQRVNSMTAMDHYHARLCAHQNSVKIIHSMSGLDLLLTPALGSDPVPVGAFDSRTSAFDYPRWAMQGDRFAPFSAICNITGQPAASLPVPLAADQPPAAVQLAGHLRQDHIVLQVSALLEKHFNWQSWRPPIHASVLTDEKQF